MPAQELFSDGLTRMRNGFHAHKPSHDYMDIDDFMLEAITESRLREGSVAVMKQQDSSVVSRMSLNQMLANAMKEHQLTLQENSILGSHANALQKTYLESVNDVPQNINDIDDHNILNCFLPVKGVDFGRKEQDSGDEIQKYKSAFHAHSMENSNFTYERGDIQVSRSLGKLVDANHEDHLHFAQKNYLESVLDVPQDINDIDDDNILNCFLPVKGVDFGRKEKEEDEVQKYKSAFSASINTPEMLLENLDVRHLFPLSGLNPNVESVNSSDGKHGFRKAVEVQAGELSAQACLDEDDQEYLDSDSSSAFPKEIKKRKPRTYKYNPKPVQHKTRRSFVPDVLKDIDYWERRKRNNEAAKKSRQERRKKELEVLTGLDALRDENNNLRGSVKKLENEMDVLKRRNEALEKQVADLLEERKLWVKSKGAP